MNNEWKMNVDHTKKLTHVSLCAGYGGIDLGLARALGAVRTIAFVEIESFAALNLVKKIEAGHLDECPVFTDLKAFPWELYRGRVDILSGGFPCQPFSSAGKRAGDSDPRHLWPHIADGVRRLGHPPIIFLENVEGIISSKLTGSEWADPEGTPVLLHVLRELERLGYEAAAGVFSASEVGAPHQRKRVFIMGCRSDLSEAGRGIVDGLLRGTERGQALAHTCDHSGRCSRASVHSDRRAVDRGGESVPSERGAQNTNAQYASDAWPAPRGAERGQELADAMRWRGQDALYFERELKALEYGKTDRISRDDAVRCAWPAARGAEQHPWEPARVTMGNAKNQGLQRCKLDEAPNPAQRRQTQNGRAAGTNTHAGGKLGDSGSKILQSDVSTMEPREREQTNEKPAARSSARRHIQGQIEPSMGRGADGLAGGLGYAELCESLDNRTDELRMLGNGVVPATAERAFRVLWKDLRAQ